MSPSSLKYQRRRVKFGRMLFFSPVNFYCGRHQKGPGSFWRLPLNLSPSHTWTFTPIRDARALSLTPGGATNYIQCTTSPAISPANRAARLISEQLESASSVPRQTLASFRSGRRPSLPLPPLWLRNPDTWLKGGTRTVNV